MKRVSFADFLPVVAAAVLVSCSGATDSDAEADSAIQSGEREPLGLMTSLPIYWPDGAALDDLVNADTQLPWIRTSLEQSYDLAALDTLSLDQDSTQDFEAEPAQSEQGSAPLAAFDRLMIVQPRGLSPADNVALDEWVNAGGHLLIALDPMLAGHYAYPLGDPRNPMMGALIPPVVERWGLSISFDIQQPLELQSFDYDGGTLPMVMSGQIALEPEGEGACLLDADDRMATCVIGEGRVTLVADATLFETTERSDKGEKHLQDLLAKAFN